MMTRISNLLLVAVALVLPDLVWAYLSGNANATDLANSKTGAEGR